MDYLKSFIIGSSAPIFIPFTIAVQNIPERKFEVNNYPIYASLYFGTANALSLGMGKMLGLTLKQRLMMINTLSILLIIVWITVNQSYNFETTHRWYQQYLMIIVGHSLAYLGVIQLLEKNI